MGVWIYLLVTSLFWTIIVVRIMIVNFSHTEIHFTMTFTPLEWQKILFLKFVAGFIYYFLFNKI